MSKDELLDELWPGSVSESVLPRCITAARRALDDDTARQEIIQTVRRRGYRFVAAVGGGEPPSSIATAPPPSAAQPSAEDGEVFVGREQALAGLRRALEAALAGRGQLVLLVGEAGIGKTRTAHHIAARARAAGAITVTGRCYEGEGAPAFWPWVQVLRGCVEGLGPEVVGAGARAADIAGLVPELREGRPELAEVPAATPEQARFRLFDSVSAMLREAAASTPMVLVLDDLHWADKPSLLLLQFLAAAMGRARLLVVGTYRDLHLSRGEPLAEVLGALTREPVYHRIVLEGLSQDDVSRFIEVTAGRTPPNGLAASVHELTEGNPFFIGEMVRLIVSEGRLTDPSAAAGLGLPPGVRAAVGRHLGALSPPCSRVLTVASVVGREFSTGVLERCVDGDVGGLLEVLDEAVRARIVDEVPGAVGRYSFAHALIRETLYEDIPTPERVALHRRVGAALEEVHRKGPQPYLTELAHHFFQGAAGGDAEPAIEYGLAAARRAWRTLAFEDAAVLYGRVLEALESQVPIDESRRTDVLMRLGEAHARSGEHTRSREAFSQAAEIARALHRPEQLARAALGFGSSVEFGMPRDDQLLALLDEALTALGATEPGAQSPSPDAGLRAQLLSRLATCAPNSESVQRRQELSASAVALARRTDDPHILADALRARYWALSGPDHLYERQSIGDEVLALHERTGDKAFAFVGHELRATTALALGDMRLAVAEIGALRALAAEVGRPVVTWYVGGFEAGRALCEGRFDEAERLISESLREGQRAKHPGAVLIGGAHTLYLALSRRRLREYTQGLAFFRKRYAWADRSYRTGLAFVSAEEGKTDVAKRAFDDLASGDFLDFARDEHWLSSMVLLAALAWRLGDEHRAALLYDLLLPFAHRTAFHDRLRIHSGSVSRFLGLLAETREDLDQAAIHFEDALRENVAMGAHPYSVRTFQDYGAMLVRRGREQDRSRARELLGEGATLASQLGMDDVRDRCRELAAQLGH